MMSGRNSVFNLKVLPECGVYATMATNVFVPPLPAHIHKTYEKVKTSKRCRVACSLWEYAKSNGEYGEDVSELYQCNVELSNRRSLTTHRDQKLPSSVLTSDSLNKVTRSSGKTNRLLSVDTTRTTLKTKNWEGGQRQHGDLISPLTTILWDT
jgi:hypothetical protein